MGLCFPLGLMTPRRRDQVLLEKGVGPGDRVQKIEEGRSEADAGFQLTPQRGCKRFRSKGGTFHPLHPQVLFPSKPREARSRQLLSIKFPAPVPCPRGLSRPPSQMPHLSLAISFHAQSPLLEQSRPGSCNGPRSPGRAGTPIGLLEDRGGVAGNLVAESETDATPADSASRVMGPGMRRERRGLGSHRMGPGNSVLLPHGQPHKPAARQPSLGPLSFQEGAILWMGQSSRKTVRKDSRLALRSAHWCRGALGFGGHRDQGQVPGEVTAKNLVCPGSSHIGKDSG